jgi:hypothetical protein
VSHLGTRLLADRLADDAEGVNIVATYVPRNDDDTLLPRTVRIYDDTRHGWVDARATRRRKTPAWTIHVCVCSPPASTTTPASPR